ncbi:hypothetical protein RHSIM_RhsimUnG0017300 [Rhododendron simsii]|uniref:MULE transposase domain-containing protein n=1 Tax=Rhododendron simsii TaxID=118357 RepID=A0A834FZN0_RHOSS|nr:hypothetical protein RHSIM_RhsimUnG0017300 [Rhododendron simsii]
MVKPNHHSDIMDQSDGSQGGHANVHNDKFNSSSCSKNDILEQKFDSEDDAHAFYNAYAKEMGFSIRKDRLKVNEANVPRKRKWCRPIFSFKYTVDEDNRLGKLFWADLKSRMDYAAFGDVLIFDTTYRTNAYKKPFVILAGVSNHFLTTIFGCALLVDETFATHTWVLETLMEAMDNKRPVDSISIDKNDYQPSATHCPSEDGYPTPPPSPFTRTGCKRKSTSPAMTHRVKRQLYTNHERTDLTPLESGHDISRATTSRDAQVCQNGSFRISEATKEDEEGAATNGAIQSSSSVL